MTAPRHPARRTRPRVLRRAWRVLAGVVRLGGRVVRGLIAAVALLALVAGLPWALCHYIGWPLPDHVPTWAEVQITLLSPMTATFLLDVLACLCWIVWSLFVLDVARCAIDAARGVRLPDLSSAGPLHTLAAVLVGAVLLSLLSNRWAYARAPLSSAPGTGTEVVATAPAWHTPPATKVVVVDAEFATRTPAGGGAAAGVPVRAESVVVLAPRHGVHDSLWRIAVRTLGDGTRWPEIFDLNKGKPQPGGLAFTKPSLIFPGDVLALPREATSPAVPPTSNPATPAPTIDAPSTTAPPPTSVQPATPVQPPPSNVQAGPEATGANTAPAATPGPGFSWGPELFVGFGLAAAVSAALVIARRRYNSRYRPGSGDRDQLPVAPVVYQLHLAHLRAHQDDEDNTDGEFPRPPHMVVGAPQRGSNQVPTLAASMGTRDSREVAVDLAAARGLGFVGAGAPAAARVLLVAALADATSNQAALAKARMVVPFDDLATVLGHRTEQAQLPAALLLVADLNEALDLLERETLVRAAAGRANGAGTVPWPPLVVAARSPQQHPRLQAVLDNGAPFGVLGVLVGQWRPGITCHVRADGAISATSPGPGESLRGTRLFRLGDDDAAELLTLLHQADPDVPDDDIGATSAAPRARRGLPRLAGTSAPAVRHPIRLETDRDGTGDLELEVTAALREPAAADTELEILDRPLTSAPGVRPRPAAVSREELTTSRPTHPITSQDEVDGDPISSGKPVPNGEAAAAASDPPAALTADDEAGVVVAAPISITVLGGLRVHWIPEFSTPRDAATDQGREITGALQPRAQELLVLLALHPGGTTRETLVSTLWGDDPPARPTNALHTALSRLRHTLAAVTDGAVTDIIAAGDGRYGLDPARVRVDYWRFADAVAARRTATTDAARVDAYRRVVDNYAGTLADGMSWEWIEPAREAIRRDAIDAVAALARALVTDDPQQTLDLLEVARAFDPHNEALYRDIMRLQERLGQLDAIPRTLTLLTTRLAEIDGQPSEQAISLATQLRQRRDDNPRPQRRPGNSLHRGRSAAS